VSRASGTLNAVSRSRSGSVLTVAALVVGAGLVAASALIHLHLWAQGYKHIHLIGPLFLLQGVVGIALAIMILLLRTWVVAITGALYLAGTALGLLTSATIGVFGFHDGLDVPWAAPSLVVELVGFVVLVAAGASLMARR